jgi:WD40 repeat protein
MAHQQFDWSERLVGLGVTSKFLIVVDYRWQVHELPLTLVISDRYSALRHEVSTTPGFNSRPIDILTAAVSPAGTHIVGLNPLGEPALLRLRSEEFIPLQPPRGGVKSVIFSLDGTQIIGGLTMGRAMSWGIHGSCLKTWTHDPSNERAGRIGDVSALALMVDPVLRTQEPMRALMNPALLTGTRCGEIVLHSDECFLRLTSKEDLESPFTNIGEVRALSGSPTGLIALASQRGGVQVIDPHGSDSDDYPTVLCQYEVDDVVSLAWLSDRLLAFQTKDGYVAILSPKTGRVRQLGRTGSARAGSLAWFPNGDFIAALGDYAVHIFRVS